MQPPEVRFARSGETSIAYAVVGDGPFDLVFVGGWVLSSLEQAWDGPAADFFQGLASCSRLILFDKRGTGLSDRVTGIPDLETRMDDVRAVMDAAGSERAAVMGFSEGGPMTLLFAATYPERTAATVLFGTGASYIGDDDYPWSPTPAEWNTPAEEPQTEVGSQEWLDQRLQVWAPSLADDEDIRQWWRRWVLTSASPGAVAALAQMNQSIDARHTLQAIHAPTLVMHRADDPTFVVDESRYIAERIPDAEFVLLPGKDHGFFVDPDQIAGPVCDFLTGIWDRGDWDLVEPDRAWRPFCSPILSTRPHRWPCSVTRSGPNYWKNTTPSFADNSPGSPARRSAPQATASSPDSMDRQGRSGVPRPSFTEWRSWAWRYGPAFTPASVNWSTTMCAASPSTSAPELLPRPGPAKCWCRERSKTWWPDPDSSLTTAAPCPSKAYPVTGNCTQPGPDLVPRRTESIS